ncbi:MAG: hypothetical protein BJG00_011970 [Limnothrix sp. CACIAM 69d]|nr:MAG: hypothetical protein BJG00_011970 [Limnothrix sp. CACIAM 69d]
MPHTITPLEHRFEVTLKTDKPAPTDAEVAVMLEERRVEKYLQLWVVDPLRGCLKSVFWHGQCTNSRGGKGLEHLVFVDR